MKNLVTHINLTLLEYSILQYIAIWQWFNIKKSKNMVFHFQFNDTMLGVQYSWLVLSESGNIHVMWRPYTALLSINVARICCVTIKRTPSNEQAIWYNWSTFSYIIDRVPIVFVIFFILVYQPNWLNKYVPNFELQINVLDDKHANNYYWIISTQLLRFLLYAGFHWSPVGHENLRSKVELKGNWTIFIKIHFLKMCKK